MLIVQLVIVRVAVQEVAIGYEIFKLILSAVYLQIQICTFRYVFVFM